MSASRPFDRLLVANRAEVAIRVLRTADELGIATCAVYSEDDADALHVRMADEARPLAGTGPVAYLDARQLIAAATDSASAAVHPGYGFLSESAAFAEQCHDSGLTFVGPSPHVLKVFGDKPASRALANQLGVPIARGTEGAVTAADARAFVDSLDGAAVIVKTVAGGGGRGMRIVRRDDDLLAAIERAQSEVGAAFGSDAIFIEELIEPARHIEIQLIGDGTGAVTHLGDRDCSVQRRHQKMIEVAPAIALDEGIRHALVKAAIAVTTSVALSGVATVEFLVRPDGRFVFLEVNPRLQVEHTVTEEITGIDLVATQLRIAAGESLAELGLDPGSVPAPNGRAIQLRLNVETPVRPTAREGNIIEVFEPPTGRGVRIDTHVSNGHRPNPRFDALLAKIVVHTASSDPAVAAAKADRALEELRISGVATNARLLRAVVRDPIFAAGATDTNFLTSRAADLAAAAEALPVDGRNQAANAATSPERRTTAIVPPDVDVVRAPMAGLVVDVQVDSGDAVAEGDTLVVLESMKMEHCVVAPTDGTVLRIGVAIGEVIGGGDPIGWLRREAIGRSVGSVVDDVDPDAVRPDLQRVLDRHALTQDEARPAAVEERHRRHRSTARETLDALCDEDTFVEYGALAIASRRGRQPVEELLVTTPADGCIAGVGHVNGSRFDSTRSRCAVMSYDYTVLAGTQGLQGHRKSDRLFELIERLRLPLVLFAEGGGGRPGDTDHPGVGYGDLPTFTLFARLRDLVPLIGIAAGRCFAGNAALLGLCDVVIATRTASIGMAGPAMIEGAGLGAVSPEEIGPAPMHAGTGVVDILVEDDAAAVETAKQYLSYFQGSVETWTAPDRRTLRTVVPENRVRSYDMRRAVVALADEDSTLELRAEFGVGILTFLTRLEGRPVGLFANNPLHLGGAIDADAAAKAADFLQLCQTFELPVVSLCDTPGFMVGSKAERTGQVRDFARMFHAGGSLTVPSFTVVLRKGYGLGAIAMAGGSWRTPIFTVAWPTAEFGAMGIEGAVHLGYRSELDAINDPAERDARYELLVRDLYERGQALNAATYFEIDDVIDPADTRQRIIESLRVTPRRSSRRSRSSADGR